MNAGLPPETSAPQNTDHTNMPSSHAPVRHTPVLTAFAFYLICSHTLAWPGTTVLANK